MIEIVVSLVWPLAIMFFVARGQLRERELPKPALPLILGGVGLLVIAVNSWWFVLSPPVVVYLLISLVIGAVSGAFRGHLTRVYWSTGRGAIVRRGSLLTCAIFLAGMLAHYGVEAAFVPLAGVLAYGNALTINLYLAASLGAAGAVNRWRARDVKPPRLPAIG